MVRRHESNTSTLRRGVHCIAQNPAHSAYRNAGEGATTVKCEAGVRRLGRHLGDHWHGEEEEDWNDGKEVS